MTVVSIYILCYNEEVLIRDTILHHKRMHPTAKITIYDNMSSDNSAAIAREMGCTVVEWDRGTEASNIVRRRIKNTCWNDVSEGWIIVCDMDEWPCITDEELDAEEKKGTTIIDMIGKNIITPESKHADLSDINLHTAMCGNHYGSNKCLIFHTGFRKINYSAGAHTCAPYPRELVKYNTTPYYFKHYDLMCLPFYINKMKRNFSRTIDDRKLNMSVHYKDKEEDIIAQYTKRTVRMEDMSSIFARYCPKT